MLFCWDVVADPLCRGAFRGGASLVYLRLHFTVAAAHSKQQSGGGAGWLAL